jgi:hypothetical protein
VDLLAKGKCQEKRKDVLMVANHIKELEIFMVVILTSILSKINSLFWIYRGIKPVVPFPPKVIFESIFTLSLFGITLTFLNPLTQRECSCLLWCLPGNSW